MEPTGCLLHCPYIPHTHSEGLLLHWLPPDVVVAVPGYGPDGCVMNANLHVPHQSVAPVMEGHDHPVT